MCISAKAEFELHPSHISMENFSDPNNTNWDMDEEYKDLDDYDNMKEEELKEPNVNAVRYSRPTSDATRYDRPTSAPSSIYVKPRCISCGLTQVE